MYLVFVCTEFIQLFNDIAAMAGYTYRIDELLQRLIRLPSDNEEGNSEAEKGETNEPKKGVAPINELQDDDNVLLAMEDVHLETPGCVLIAAGKTQTFFFFFFSLFSNNSFLL